MAVAACVHPRVMTRALLRLRELGYVDYRSGYGYYVSDGRPNSAECAHSTHNSAIHNSSIRRCPSSAVRRVLP